MSSQDNQPLQPSESPDETGTSHKSSRLLTSHVKIAVITSIVLLALLTLFPLLQTGFTTKDDSEIVLQAAQHGDSIRYAMNFAALQGRFYFISAGSINQRDARSSSSTLCGHGGSEISNTNLCLRAKKSCRFHLTTTSSLLDSSRKPKNGRRSTPVIGS